MDTKATSNPLESLRSASLQPFASNIEGFGTHAPAAAFLVLKAPSQTTTQDAVDVLDALGPQRCFTQAERTALAATAKQLGYAPDDVTFATLPLGQAVTMVEGLDPICVVSADRRTTEELARAYRCKLPLDGMGLLLCRPCACLSDLAKDLESPEGKRRAWAVLKELPKLPA